MRMKPMCIREMTSSFPLMKSGDGRISREIGPTPVGAAPDAAAEFELPAHPTLGRGEDGMHVPFRL